MAPTIIAHGDIRHDLLQYCLSFRELLVLALCCEQFCSKFLQNREREVFSRDVREFFVVFCT